MQKLPPESNSCVVVQSRNDQGGMPDFKDGLRIAALLLIGLLAWRIVWPLVSMVVVNPWLVGLAVCVFTVAAYFPMCWFMVWLISSIRDGSPDQKTESYNPAIRYWVITGQSVTRHYANHFQCLSRNSIQSCVLKDQHLQITYATHQIDQLPLDGFSTDTQRQVAQTLLSSQTADADALESLTNSIEIQSSYSKKALKTVKAHCPVQRYERKNFYKRTILMAVLYAVFAVADAAVHGKAIFVPNHFVAFFALTLPEVLAQWLTVGNAYATRHFWRISMDGFRFGTWTGKAYQETSRQWSDLQEVVETPAGLVLKFQYPQQTSLLPRDTISLMDWSESVEAIRLLSEKDVVVVNEPSALEPKMIGC